MCLIETRCRPRSRPRWRLRRMPEPTFFLVDPNLRDLTGHYFEYARSLVQPVERLGYLYVALGHRQADPVVARSIPFEGVFTRTIWDTFPTVGALPRIGRDAEELLSNISFYASLRVALPADRVDTGCAVLAHMI